MSIFDNLIPERWRPLSVRENPEASAEYDALVDDIPDWMLPSLCQWVLEAVEALRTDMNGRHPDLFGVLERRLRISLDRSKGFEGLVLDLLRPMERSTAYALNVLDCLLDLLPWTTQGRDLPGRLAQMLTEASFSFRVGQYGDKLERRIDETVTRGAETLMNAPGRAAEHLRAAWDAIYRLTPDPTGGYREAVRAVEATAIAVVEPNNASATLGTVLGTLRADLKNPPSKWSVRFSPSSKGPVPLAVLVEMVALLWTAQQDRHGTPDQSVPANVTLEEAQAALHLALTLVQWFESGAVSKV